MGDPRAPYKHDPRKVSKSKVQDFDECRLRYKLQAIDGIQTHPSQEIMTGVVGHEALMTMSQFCKEPDAALIEQACLFATTQGVGNALARQLAQKIIMESIHMIDFSQAIATERTLEVDLGDGFTLNGVLDRVDLVVSERRLRIVDYKFGRWVPPGSLEDDAQAQFYLSLGKAHAKALTGLDDVRHLEVSFERAWMALQFYQGPVYWNPDLERRARARAITHAREVEAEKEFKPTVGAHCKRCPFVGSCPAVTEELERRIKILPLESVTLPADELYERARFAKETIAIATGRYKAIDLQIRAMLDLAGPIKISNGATVDFGNKRGWRAWDEADPSRVHGALNDRFGKAPPLAELTVSSTNGDAVKKFVKSIPPKQREEAEIVLDRVAPRKVRQHLDWDGGEDSE